MRTRTLLLLSLGCLIAISAAGVAFLIRLAGDEGPEPARSVGVAESVGDLSVTVLDASEVDGSLTIDLELGGVDDPDGGDSFRLISSGRPAPMVEDGCSPVTVEDSPCALRFDVSAADGNSRVLFVERGEEQGRWVLVVD
ncbi:MAG: hypothetical protein ACO3NQ_01400 [Ilumatobacteraceae bacterium]